MDYIVKRILNSMKLGLDRTDIDFYFDGKPKKIPDDIFMKGVLIVNPLSNRVKAVTTGITEEETFPIEIIVGKLVKLEAYKKAQTVTGLAELRRIVEGSDANGLLLTNTVRHIIRSNMRQWGRAESDLEIRYDTNEYDNNGVETATLTLEIKDYQQQNIS